MHILLDVLIALLILWMFSGVALGLVSLIEVMAEENEKAKTGEEKEPE